MDVSFNMLTVITSTQKYNIPVTADKPMQERTNHRIHRLVAKTLRKKRPIDSLTAIMVGA
jgi:hypothetical protein